jgi:hypothetical protein
VYYSEQDVTRHIAIHNLTWHSSPAAVQADWDVIDAVKHLTTVQSTHYNSPKDTLWVIGTNAFTLVDTFFQLPNGPLGMVLPSTVLLRFHYLLPDLSILLLHDCTKVVLSFSSYII